MFTFALLNELGREGSGVRPTEEVLRLAFGESGTAEWSRNRLIGWRHGEMSRHELARERCRCSTILNEGFSFPQHSLSSDRKKTRDRPAPSLSVNSPSASQPSKKVRMY